jgi:uncharacterized protein
MFVASWSAIFMAAWLILLSDYRRLGLSLLIIGYACALADGQLGATALLPILLLLYAAWAVSAQRPRPWKVAGHVLFIALALGLSLHWLPGFHNPRVIGPERFTPTALPFTMYLNLDKPLIGFWLLLALPWIHAPQGMPRSLPHTLRTGGACLLITTSVCMGLAVVLGLVTWEPKLPATSWLWLLNNLLLVTLAEEALFRGYLQGGIRQLLQGQRYADALAIAVTALLFGLAHAASGERMIVLAGIAGIGYGVAYRLGGLRAAVLTHFGLNLTHFFLFTYPLLQPLR